MEVNGNQNYSVTNILQTNVLNRKKKEMIHVWNDTKVSN